MLSEKVQTIIKNLPDREGAENFYLKLAGNHPVHTKKLAKNEGLLSDLLTLAAFSPLLATTLLQNPDYIWWLNRQRISAKVRGKEEILESLARFALTNSQIEPNILLARFRRRELLRIYLRDVRNLGTIAEITEEISNLADAILEYALRLSQQELDNRYGIPLEIDNKERAKQARFCVVALGKLGSNELNYASDIDLLFLYSNDGVTSGHGSRNAVTNREYFVKLSEFVTKIVGGQTGEGAAYRVDLRLRPHGRVGTLAISVSEAVKYYQNSAQSWERQVLIRSRACAGETKVFQSFFKKVENKVFSSDETVENALQNVRLSKDKINLENLSDKSFNVKLGKGGIREIEFIAQALQLAYGGKDEWLRASHTLISLTRLSDRKLLTENEMTSLFDAYDFLRRLEHRLQMENGLQIYFIPKSEAKLTILARRMNYENAENFEDTLKFHTTNVNRIFRRIFDEKSLDKKTEFHKKVLSSDSNYDKLTESNLQSIFYQIEESDEAVDLSRDKLDTLEVLSKISPHFAQMIASNPRMISQLPNFSDAFEEKEYLPLLSAEIENANGFAQELAALRKIWTCFLLEIVIFDVFEKITIEKAKKLQTKLAEAAIEAALLIVKNELARKFENYRSESFPLTILGLGKLGGGGMDYGSDLDLILIYDEISDSEKEIFFQNKTEMHLESKVFHARAVEIFVTILSSLTRDGHLYRVDLRLRPDGKNGATSLSRNAFLNYLKNRSAIWEWLAYVKLRGVAGDLELAENTEYRARQIVHENAQTVKITERNFELLREETRSIRQRLEEKKAKRSPNGQIDIKFGEGGMLDIYFAVRFLQLRDNVSDEGKNRSTSFTLERLYENNSLETKDYQNFCEGYKFLSELDHNLRLTVGRSTRLPAANQEILHTIAKRMNLFSVQILFETLTYHRLNIRNSFENVLA